MHHNLQSRKHGVAMDSIKEAIEKGELPPDRSTLLRPLLDDADTYVSQEGNLWDFKREWPFSHSDEYFGAIARLICAFSNTAGGIIIFGVHDDTRRGGHNKVSPNMDRLLQALSQLLSDVPGLVCKRYDQGTPHAVDVLLIKPLGPAALPTRFTRSVGKWGAGTIWVRQGHEVISAEPRHVATLYCRSLVDTPDLQDDYLTGGLPPSPATIKRFVGRINTIDKIFRWLKSSDEPRTFLYGKGGSGKSTIAYEVAKVLRTDGAHIKINGEETLDNVLFVTAKQQTLDVLTQTPGPFVGLEKINLITDTARLMYKTCLEKIGPTNNPHNSH